MLTQVTGNNLKKEVMKMILRFALIGLVWATAYLHAADTQQLTVPDLPSWVIAPAFAVDDMPDITSAEHKKNCTFEVKGYSFGDNGQKEAAIKYVRQVRYIDVLKAYLDKQSQNITQRKQFIDSLKDQITIRRDRISVLQDLIKNDQVLLQANITSLANQKTTLVTLQNQLKSSKLQDIMNQTVKALQDAQQQLKQAQSLAGKQVTLDPTNQQNIVLYIQWIKYFRANGQTLLQEAQNKLADNKKQLDAYQAATQKNPQYKPYVDQAQKIVTTSEGIVDTLAKQQAAAQSDAATQLLQRVMQDDVKPLALDQAYKPDQATTYQSRLVTLKDLQTALSALPQSGMDYASLVKRIQNSVKTTMADLQTSFDAQAQTELFTYKNAMDQANFFVAQQDYYNKVITDHQNEITRLQKEIEKLIAQIQNISDVINKQLVPTINAVKGCKAGEPCATITARDFMSIQDLVTKIQNPSSDMFNGCPYFLQDLLKK